MEFKEYITKYPRGWASRIGFNTTPEKTELKKPRKKRMPTYGRNGAWIDPSGEVYHCGMNSHAAIFQKEYQGNEIDKTLVGDNLEDMWTVVEKTGWIRVLGPEYVVKTIDSRTFQRIKNFLIVYPNFVERRMGMTSVSGQKKSFSLEDVETD